MESKALQARRGLPKERENACMWLSATIKKRGKSVLGMFDHEILLERRSETRALVQPLRAETGLSSFR